MHRPLVARATSAVLAGVLVASGAGAAAAAAPTQRKPPVEISGDVNAHGKKKAKGGEIEIEVNGELFFAPTYVKVPKKFTSVDVTLVVEGNLPHTFTIDGTDIDAELAAGDTVTITVPVGTGSVVFYCRLHQGSGMQGAFFHKKGVAPGAPTAVTSRTTSSSRGNTGGSGSSGGGIDYGY